MIGRLQSVLVHTDPLLHPFLQAEKETEAEQQLSDLVAGQIQPLVREITSSRLDSRSRDGQYSTDSEDICHDVVLQLLHRLRELRNNPETSTISNLCGYVATVTYNCCTQSLRMKYPERQRLKNRLRYVLNHDPRLAMWEHAESVCVGGFAAWKDQRISPRPSRTDAPDSAQDLPGELRELPTPELLASIFQMRGRPIEIEELVTIVARISGIHDLQRVEAGKEGDEGQDQDLWNRIPDQRVAVDVVVEQRIFLSALWKEICELRPLQRAALLLNLRDTRGEDMLPMFLLTEVTHFSELAGSLGMQREQLAELWNDLPLEDAIIAIRIGVSRQQVINLRKSARERLARRMAKIW